MALTLSHSESESGFGLESDEEDEIYSNLSHSDLIHDFMSHCQDKARHLNVVKKQLDFIKRRIGFF